MTVKPSAGNASVLTWVKSSYSTSDGPECVEIAAAVDTVQVRDSKNTPGPQLGFERGVWAEFIRYASGT